MRMWWLRLQMRFLRWIMESFINHYNVCDHIRCIRCTSFEKLLKKLEEEERQEQ